MVLGVVILHAACAYATIIPWWSVLESKPSQLFDLLVLFLDIYQMPILYFLAGYFAISSLQSRGIGGFVLAKLKRLGLPLLLIGIFFVPIIPYIGFSLQASQPMDFFKYWWMQMITAMDWHWVHITNEEIAARHAQDYSQWHLWFISLLLIFFLLTAVTTKIFPQLIRKDIHHENEGTRSILSSILVFGFAGAVVTSLINHISPDWSWAKIGALVMIQPTRVPIYVAFFILGLWAYRKNWFKSRQFPINPWLWLAACVVLVVLLLAVMISIGPIHAPIPWSLACMHSTLRIFAALAFLCFFLSAGQRWWQKPTASWRHMHPISYDIYLVHLPLVVIFQLVALYFPLPIGVEFLIIGLLAVVVSWGIGRMIIRPYPFLAVGLLLAGFGLVAVWFN